MPTPMAGGHGSDGGRSRSSSNRQHWTSDNRRRRLRLAWCNTRGLPVSHRNFAKMVVAVGLLAGLLLLGSQFTSPPAPDPLGIASPMRTKLALIGRASVIDGDTIEIHGRRIRLYGIDAPESGQSCEANGGTYRCG